MSKFYSLYQQHPTWFAYDANNSLRGSMTQQPAYDLFEKQYMPYLQGDWLLLHNRLRLTGGVRYEKTHRRRPRPSHRQQRAYQKYSDGSTKRDRDVVGTNGLPTTRAGNPVFSPASPMAASSRPS